MNELQKLALSYLHENWHIGLAGSSDAAEILGMNPNTLKTRIARRQAMVMRHHGGEVVKPLTFTGFHLIYNLIQDRMMRFGFSAGEENDPSYIAYVYADWVKKNVLSGDFKVDAVMRLAKDQDGREHIMLYEDGEVLDWTGDAAVIIPIGTMAVRIAYSMLMRSGDVERIRKVTGG